MREVTAIVMATDLPARLYCHAPLSKSLHGREFSRRILSLDVIDGGSHGFDSSWEELRHDRAGLFASLASGLALVDTEWVMYIEDDVIIREVPLFDDLEHLSHVHDCPIVLYNSGCVGRPEKCSRGFFIKPDSDDAWMISFPVAIMKTDVLRSLVEGCSPGSGDQIEQAMTSVWRGMSPRPNIAVFSGSDDKPSPSDAYMDYADNGYCAPHTHHQNFRARVLL